MIFQIVLSCILFGVCYGRNDDEIKGWFFSLAVDCNNHYPIDNEELKKLQEHIIPDSQDSKCLMACVFKKANLIDEKGTYNLTSTNEWITKEFGDEPNRHEQAKNFFDLCKKVNDEPVSDGEKGCDRGYLLAKCLTENAPKT